MRKLKILKTIVDMLWVISIPILLILIITIPTIFFIEDLSTFEIFNIKIPSIEKSIYVKLFIIPILISGILTYISVYYFKQILEDFIHVKIFSEKVINYFSKIGKLLITSGVLLIIGKSGITFFRASKFEIQLMLSPQILCICFGLFCLVLSEIFKISNQIKQENELTI